MILLFVVLFFGVCMRAARRAARFFAVCRGKRPINGTYNTRGRGALSRFVQKQQGVIG